MLAYSTPWELMLGAEALWRWSRFAPAVWLAAQGNHDLVQSLSRHRLAHLLDSARRHSTFYRRHYSGIAPHAALEAYPMVTRAVLMEHFNDWVTNAAIRRSDVDAFIADPNRLGEPYLGRYAVWTSSGTTGHPGIYIADPDTLAIYQALLTTRLASAEGATTPWHCLASGGRIAMVAATEGHYAGIVSWERERRLHPWISTRARAISILEPIAQIVADLNQWQPSLLSSYPTMLSLLAEEQRAGRLHIKPSVLWSGGENLGAPERDQISRVFGSTILEEYGASECMSIAFGCRDGGLHVNADWVILEPVDELYRPVPAGVASHTTLLTNLANHVQPIIRYDLGDSITVLTEPCSCAVPLPRIRVEGRRDDILTLPGRDGRPVKLAPLALETVVENAAGLHSFQLMQTDTTRLRLRLGVTEPRSRKQVWRRVSERLTHYLAGQGASTVSLQLDPGLPESDPRSGKLRHIVVSPSKHRPGPPRR
jgi:putative adenylate-forming enzyme